MAGDSVPNEPEVVTTHTINANGWIISFDSEDTSRWKPEDVLPTVFRAIGCIETIHPQSKMKGREQLLSEDFRFPIRNKEDCVLIVTRFPKNPAGTKGSVWIGVQSQALSHRRYCSESAAKNGIIRKPFRINLPPTQAN